MKTRFPIFVALLVGAALPLPSFADNPHDGMNASARGAVQTLSAGTVQKVSAATGRITLAHGPLDNLNMPAMTMSFSARDKGLLKGIKPGDRVRFRAEQIDDELVVTQLKRER